MTVRIDLSPAIKSSRHPLDEVCIKTIHTLAIDGIHAANSGHPVTPMAMAPVGYYLCQYVMRFDRRTRSGPTVSVLCCRPVTRRCCSTRF